MESKPSNALILRGAGGRREADKQWAHVERIWADRGMPTADVAALRCTNAEHSAARAKSERALVTRDTGTVMMVNVWCTAAGVRVLRREKEGRDCKQHR